MIRCRNNTSHTSQEKGMLLNTFGRRLKVLRMDRELSQVELRDALKKYGVDIGETYISELERTAKMPSLEVAAAMARALDVSLDYLGLISDEAHSYRQEAEPSYISPEADTVAQLIDGMNQESRELVLNLARSLAATATDRLLREDEAINILDSIERQHGRRVRDDIERLWRNKGMFVDSNP